MCSCNKNQKVQSKRTVSLDIRHIVRSNSPYTIPRLPCAALQLKLGSTHLEDIQCGDRTAFREAQGVREYVRGEESACYSLLLP